MNTTLKEIKEETMRQVRRGVFETNSSSTHSITMCAKSDYERWKKGELFLNERGNWGSYSPYKTKKFVTREEAIDIVTNNRYRPDEPLESLDEDDFLEALRERDIYTYDDYGTDFEWFDASYTTPSGEEVIAFGYYGYDG